MIKVLEINIMMTTNSLHFAVHTSMKVEDAGGAKTIHKKMKRSRRMCQRRDIDLDEDKSIKTRRR
jgi:hypothetical protein